VFGAALIARAAALYDAGGYAPRFPLHRASFAGGGRWMAEALARLRGAALPAPLARDFSRAGIRKYGAALAAALPALVLSGAGIPLAPAIIGAALAFYAVEAPLVFVFPALIDGAPHPAARSRRLVRVNGGHARAVVRVMGIALHMTLGGALGGGVRRAWCVGCLAVLLWYEDARREAGYDA
jgi:hypothetical protein